jgi:putative toxin-antitoxin system antitoxin component (TIGR02293 family)
MSREGTKREGSKSGTNRPAPKGKTKSAGGKVARKSASASVVAPKRHTASVANRSGRGQAFSYKSVDDKNALDIIDVVRKGISYSDFNKIAVTTPFSLSEWASYLQLSERTIQRNQKEKKPFQPIQSERIVELNMLYQYGVEVFGDKDNFNVWLNSKSMALGGRSPKELLDTKFGINMVKDELGRIEHGVLA